MSGVQIRVRANSREAREDLRKLEKSVGNIETAAGKMQSAFKNAAVALGTLFASGKITKGLISAGDSLNQLGNRVALVTGRGKELERGLTRLYAISARSRTSIGTTVETFNRFSLALRDSNKSQESILAVTEAVGKAAVLSGASAESARAAIIQLGQGLAAGQLRGEELNSVLEQTPRVAQAIAEGLGVPFGQLKSLAQDGKITSEAVFEAIVKQAGKINKEFELIKPTVQDLTVVMRDEFTRALSAIDSELGFSDRAARKIEQLTTAFRFVANNVEFAAYVIRRELNDIRMVAQGFTESISLLFGEMFKVDFDFTSLKTRFDTAVGEFKTLLGIGEDGESPLQKVFDVQIPTIDLSGYVNFGNILSQVQTWASNMKEVIVQLFKDWVGDSYWPAIFEEGHSESNGNSIGNPRWLGILNTVVGWVKNFGSRMVNSIKDTAKDIVANWGKIIDFIYGKDQADPRGEDAIPTKSLLDGLNEMALAAKRFNVNLLETVTTSGLFIAASDTISSKWSSARDSVKAIREDIEASGGLVATLEKAFDKTGETAGKTAKGALKSIENALLGTQVEDPYADPEKGIRREGGVVEKVYENKGAILGASIAGAFAYAFPAAATEVLQLAGLGIALGFANALGYLLSEKLPFTLILTAVIFDDQLKAILNSQSFNTALKDIAFKITEGIKNALGLGGTDAGEQIGDGLTEAIAKNIASIGEGIADAIFGENFKNAAVERLLGSLGLIFAGFTFAGIAKNGIFGFSRALGFAIFSRDWSTFFGNQLGLEIEKSAGKEETKAKTGTGKYSKLGALGKALGRGISGGIQGYFVAEGIGLGAELFTSGMSKEAQDAGDSIANVLGNAAQFGLTALAATGNPFVALGVGLTAALVAGLTDPYILSTLQDFLQGVGNMFEDYIVNPIKNAINRAFGVDETGNRIEDLDASESLTRFESQKADIKQRIRDLETAIADGSAAANGALQEHQEMISNEKLNLQDVNAQIKSLKEDEVRFAKEAAKSAEEYAEQIAIVNSYLKQYGIEPRQQSSAPPIERASGGYISGPGGPKDDLIPALLSNGEFVIQASAVSKFGTGFLDALNRGTLRRFSGGSSYADYQMSLYKGQLSTLDEDINKYQRLADQAMQVGDTTKFKNAMRTVERAKATRDNIAVSLEALQLEAAGGLDAATKGTSGGGVGTGGKKKEKSFGLTTAEGFVSDLKAAFTEVFKTGDFKSFFKNILDSFTTKVIENFTNGLVDSLFESITKGGEDSALAKVFKGIGNIGSDIGKKSAEAIAEGAKDSAKALKTGNSKDNPFAGLGNMFSGLVNNLLGLTGGGGLFSSLFGQSFGSFLGFGGPLFANSGGFVPETPYSRSGVDSVPAMLTPGELIVPADKVDSFMKNRGGSGQTVVNLSITGDVSRQTRQEIVKMLPTIASGVNAQNKERNFKYR